MGTLDTDIKKLYGVGAVKASAYATLGVRTVGDLLHHYPRGYEDRGNIKLIIARLNNPVFKGGVIISKVA
jgi:ATP-dependent DNA helicase RecG